MRQRITFIHAPQDSIDPETLTITPTSLIAPGEITAAREDRITFALNELPQEIYLALKSCHEIHVKWSGEKSYFAVDPFSSRVSPGLHVFFTPGLKGRNSELICPILTKVFGDIDCESPEKSFTSVPNDRFSHSATHQYYSPLPSLQDLTLYIQHKLCPPNSPDCHTRVSSLSSASQVDIDFDSISHALTITSFWSPRPWTLDIIHSISSSRLEIGILSNEKPVESEELSLAGFLTVLGSDTKPSPTLFSFPARHHLSPTSTTFTTTFLRPTGLHPTLQLNISDAIPPFPPEERDCKLHAYVTLPKAVFADKYQLGSDNELFLREMGLGALRYISEPTDLEAPAYTVPTWGSSLLLELSPPSPSPPSSSQSSEKEPQQWISQIPLHLRYLSPTNSSETMIEIPDPVLFWACTAEEGSKFAVNPFDRVGLGYEGLFGGMSMFFHLEPRGSGGELWSSEGEVGVRGELMNKIAVPVLDEGYGGLVVAGTGVVVLAGFLWVVWCLVGVGLGKNEKRGVGKVKKEQ